MRLRRFRRAEGAPAPTTKGFIAFEPMVAITNALNLAHKGVYKELQSIPPALVGRELLGHDQGLLIHRGARNL